MFTTPSIYWGFILRNTVAIAGISTSAVDSLWPALLSVEDCLGQNGPCEMTEDPDEVSPVLSGITRLVGHDIPLEYCVGTAALTTNIIIGDAIIWGRVYVLWPRNQTIRLVLVLLLLGTIATGVVSTAHACQSPGQLQQTVQDPSDETAGTYSLVGPAAGNLMGSFFEGDPFGFAATVLGLATNVTSTCLIGFRAWEHRALARGNGLKHFLGRSQVSRALALLIESGAFYSAIWIIVVVYQSITRPYYAAGTEEMNTAGGITQSSTFHAFTASLEAFTEGGLVIVIAIYPTVIMLLVALNRSECDTIASCRDNGQDAAVPSLVFRGSDTHGPGQSVDRPSCAMGQAFAESNADPESASSLVDIDTVSTAKYSERRCSITVVGL
ncbi:hypothetical protein V8D89_000688 [Ganoderma adspersum]